MAVRVSFIHNGEFVSRVLPELEVAADPPVWLPLDERAALQRELNELTTQLVDSLAQSTKPKLIIPRSTPMTRPTDYTTEELERLTTLTEATAKPGEFVRRVGVTTLRLADNKVACSNGAVHCVVVAEDCFTRWIEIRRASATTTAKTHAAGMAEPADYCGPERRVRSFTDPTPLDPPQADLLAELARRRVPKFKVGDLATHATKNWGEVCPVVETNRYTTVLRAVNGYKAMYCTADLRPATDAEVAAYHRQHCQPKVGPKPAKPAPISNATHAGKKVRWFGGDIDYIVAKMGDGRIVAAPGIAVFLIEPSCGVIRYCYNANELALSDAQ